MLTVQEVAERVGHWTCHVCGEQGHVHDMLVAEDATFQRVVELRRWFDLLWMRNSSPGARTLPPRCRRPRKDAKVDEPEEASTLRSPRCGVGRTTTVPSKAVGRPTDFCYLRRTEPTESARGVGDARAHRMTFVPTLRRGGHHDARHPSPRVRARRVGGRRPRCGRARSCSRCSSAARGTERYESAHGSHSGSTAAPRRLETDGWTARRPPRTSDCPEQSASPDGCFIDPVRTGRRGCSARSSAPSWTSGDAEASRREDCDPLRSLRSKPPCRCQQIRDLVRLLDHVLPYRAANGRHTSGIRSTLAL